MEDNQKNKNEDDRLFLARKNNLEKIIDSGLDPYPKSFPRTHTSVDSVNALEGFEKGSLEESSLEDVKIAGRVVGIRGVWIRVVKSSVINQKVEKEWIKFLKNIVKLLSRIIIK